MKKGVVITITILLVYLGVMYFFFGKDNLKEQKANDILLIHYGTKFKYNNYKWTKMEEEDYLEYNGKFYDVYQEQSLYGNYELTFNNKWYLFDKNRNLVNYDYELFAHHGEKKLEFIPYNVINIDSGDSKVINEAIKLIGIEDYTGLVEGEKVTINYDNDYRDETFYIIKNELNEKVFTIAFFVDGKDIKIIDYDLLDKEESIMLKFYNFHSIIDIGLDKKYEVIISQSTFGEHIPYCHYMFYKGREIDVVTSCKAR